MRARVLSPCVWLASWTSLSTRHVIAEEHSLFICGRVHYTVTVIKAVFSESVLSDQISRAVAKRTQQLERRAFKKWELEKGNNVLRE